MPRHAPENYLVRCNEQDLLLVGLGGECERLAAGARTGDDTSFAYGYVFGRRDDAELACAGALTMLGEAMMSEPGPRPPPGDIPAGYTYLGQFIFHDISHLDAPGGSNAPANLRTPALDLDSVLSARAFAAVSAGASCEESLTIGLTSQGRPIAQDLPRRPWVDNHAGLPLIADERNDDFLPLAQCHMMLLRFFNAVARSRGPGRGAGWWKGVRARWRQHFQSVVLHDYLPRIIDRATYDDVLQNGRRIVRPRGEKPPRESWMPIEFAGAVGRFGHSMIRDSYRPWNSNVFRRTVDIGRFMSFSYRNSGDRLARHNGALPSHWATNWRNLFDFPDHRPGESTPRPLMAARIDTRLAAALGQLPNCLRHDMCRGDPARQQSFSLPVTTLLRGRELKLATAQQALARVDATLGMALPRLGDDQIAPDRGPVAGAFATHPELRTRTPLWYYILKEAEVLADGLRLGPLGGRIVMETVHAAIDTSPDSILAVPGWRPSLPGARADIFTMPDLIAFAGDPDPLHT